MVLVNDSMIESNVTLVVPSSVSSPNDSSLSPAMVLVDDSMIESNVTLVVPSSVSSPSKEFITVKTTSCSLLDLINSCVKGIKNGVSYDGFVASIPGASVIGAVTKFWEGPHSTLTNVE